MCIRDREGIAKLESSGLKVNDVVVFLDHGGRQDTSAKKRLNAKGLKIQSVLSLETISEVLEEAERISASQAEALRGTRP